jgi:hypothetical protein
MEKIVNLIESELTDYKEMIQAAKKEKETKILLHQDAFASDYSDKELMLLGSAIKYAGLHGIAVEIMGVNGETIIKDNEPNT